MYTLVTLPVELLYDIQLFAMSHALPQTCRILYDIFASSPSSYRAQYLIACTDSARPQKDSTLVLTKILRYPICTPDVLDAYFRSMVLVFPDNDRRSAPELPRRLFRVLTPARSIQKLWTECDPPLPLLRYLFACPYIHPPNVDAHDGYALTKAVQAGFVPLVRFLLDQGAMPTWKNNLAIIVAIHRRDLGLVRMLVERVDTTRLQGKRKRRKLEDRVVVTPAMLKAAIECKSQDIVEYLTREKGCIPDMQTLLLMR